MLHTSEARFPPLQSVAGKILPCLWIDASELHIGLQVVFVALLWTTLRPGTWLQFRVEASIRDPATVHSVDMSNTSKLCYDDESFYARYCTPVQDFCIGYFIFPLDPGYMVQAAHMELIKAAYMTPMVGPRLTAMVAGWQYEYVIDTNLLGGSWNNRWKSSTTLCCIVSCIHHRNHRFYSNSHTFIHKTCIQLCMTLSVGQTMTISHVHFTAMTAVYTVCKLTARSHHRSDACVASQPDITPRYKVMTAWLSVYGHMTGYANVIIEQNCLLYGTYIQYITSQTNLLMLAHSWLPRSKKTFSGYLILYASVRHIVSSDRFPLHSTNFHQFHSPICCTHILIHNGWPYLLLKLNS